MGKKKSGTDVTYWHPAFYADIQIELTEDADNLEFENEHQLGTNPMEIDVLIIKKEKDRPVKKNIGKIFRKYNIIEYKSPDDSLNVDDFYKVYGYTCFYKADVPHVDSIPIQELTITFVSERYPRKLLRHLQEVKRYTVERIEAGIYQIHGDLIPMQVIVTKRLSERKNLWLKSLTNKLDRIENAEKLVTDYRDHPKNNLYQSVIETIIRANRKTFEEVNGMGDIFMEIVQEKFDKKLREAIEVETEKVRNKLTEELRNEVTEELRNEVTEKVTNEVTKKVTNEVTKKVTNEVTKKITNEVTKKVTNEVTEKVTDEVTKKVTKSVTEKTRLMERISLIQKKCIKKKPLPVIADELETEPNELFSIYDIIFKNPEKSVEELYELVAGTAGA